MSMKIKLLVIVIVVQSIVFCSLLVWNDGKRDSEINNKGIYSRLDRAETMEEIRGALVELGEINEYAGAIDRNTSRKSFRFLTDKENNVDRILDNDCSLVGHLAAISGDDELLRLMVRKYFGSAEGEIKGCYVEVFLQYNPDLFFSLPDTWHIWQAAGGAAWCLDEPKVTTGIVADRVSESRDAVKIMGDIERVLKEEAETEWSKEALEEFEKFRKRYEIHKNAHL